MGSIGGVMVPPSNGWENLEKQPHPKRAITYGTWARIAHSATAKSTRVVCVTQRKKIEDIISYRVDPCTQRYKRPTTGEKLKGPRPSRNYHHNSGPQLKKESNTIDHPLKRVTPQPDDPPVPQPAAPFAPTINTTIIMLRQAYRSQSEVGWDNFMKRRIVQQWERYIEYHLQHNTMNLNKREWPEKLILALWDHLFWIWMFRNGVVHTHDNGQTSRYKVEEATRKMDAV
jgi:hypothetical protein